MKSESTAPALERGIRVLRFLESREQESLDAIARELGYPKSSLLRVLDTLINENLVDKDPVSNAYYAKAVLVPRGRLGYTVRQEQLERVLKALARETGCTTEWYVPLKEGMILVRQAEPDRIDARIWAREGYVRSFVGELEAVACLGNAWVLGAPDPKGKYSTYDTDGNRTKLSGTAVSAMVKAAKEKGYVADTVYNGNGVRRLACVVIVRDVPAGVLAIAEHYRPRNDAVRAERLEQLLTAGRELTPHGHLIY